MTAKKFFIDALKAKKQFAPPAAQQGFRIAGQDVVTQLELSYDAVQQAIRLESVVLDKENTYRPTLMFHRQTANLTTSICQCTEENLCCHAYATLLVLERDNQKHVRQSGVIDVSHYFLSTQALEQISHSSQQWALQQEQKQREIDLEVWEQESIELLIGGAVSQDLPLMAMRWKLLANPRGGQYSVRLLAYNSLTNTETIVSIKELQEFYLEGNSYIIQGITYREPKELFNLADWEQFLWIVNCKGEEDSINAVQFVKFIELAHIKKWNNISLNQSEQTLEIKDEPFKVNVSLVEEKNFYHFSRSADVPAVEGAIKRQLQLITVATPWLLIIDQRIVLCTSKNITERHTALFQYLEIQGLPKQLFPSFCNNILPHLPPDIQVEIPEATKSLYKEVAQPLIVEVVFDTIGIDRLSVSFSFHYGPYTAEIKKKEGVILFPAEMVLPRELIQEQEILKFLLSKLQYDQTFARFSISADEFIPYYQNLIAHPKAIAGELVCRFSQSLEKKTHYLDQSIKLSVQSTGNRNFFEVGFEIPHFLKDIPLEVLRESLSKGHKIIRTKKGDFFFFDKNEVAVKNAAALLELLEGLHVENFSSLKSKVTSRWNLWSLYCRRKDCAFEWDQTTEDIFISQIDCAKDLPLRKIPKKFNGELRPYQKEGFDWLCRLQAGGFEGILADDMGLGKTIQTIVFLASEKENKAPHPSLVVCPTSLLENWHNEIRKFAPSLVTHVVTGTPEERQALLHNGKGVDVWITSYNLLQKDIQSYLKLNFHYIILDEAQHIKNPTTRNALLAKQLVATHRLILTGTPIENSLKDLWSLFDFIMPGFLHSYRTFTQLYPVSDQEAKERLKRRIEPFILRRLKKDVLDELPPVNHIVARCELDVTQKGIYRNLVEQIVKEVDAEIVQHGSKQAHIHILAGLTRLKQLCCHPLLLGVEAPSAKFDLLLELVDELLDGGHRAIIFSQYTKMLHLISQVLQQKKIRHSYLDGSVKNRLERVEEFNRDTEIPFFLISLRAGGIGLNLVGADRVIHYDLWWNPAVENQATDRVHRIGQTESVTSYKLITNGTIEQKILELQGEKQQLINTVVGENSYNLLAEMSWTEIKERLLEST
ncbi:MAG: helicase 2 family protein [Chlamydiales bacterium]|jgi:superfamily II DNA or RNA helicase|nr:helicase 2 family protein [Chlamydiales bacterium]